MINKTSRLNRSEIDDLKQSPLKHRARGVLVLYKKNTLNFPKIAVVVSKKIDKSAVGRNRLKRIISKEVIKHLSKHKNLSASLIIYPSKEFVNFSQPEKSKSITNIFEFLCQEI